MVVRVAKAVDPRAPGLPPVPSGVTEISRGVVRILAPNPSPMTLDGTNTYLVCDLSRRRAIVIDPGPVMPEHLGAIVGAVRSRELEVRLVITTHAHPDHAAAGQLAAEEFKVRLVTAQELAGSMRSGAVLAEIDVRVLATPGHSADSLSYVSADGILMSGDHLLGRGTTAILHPDGSLGQYLRSLTVVEGAHFAMIAPGHGPAMDADLGRQVIAYYRAHRLERIEQVRSLLDAGVTQVSSVVSAIYGPVEDPVVAWSARASTLATIAYLGEDGDWTLEGDQIVHRLH